MELPLLKFKPFMVTLFCIIHNLHSNVTYVHVYIITIVASGRKALAQASAPVQHPWWCFHFDNCMHKEYVYLCTMVRPFRVVLI